MAERMHNTMNLNQVYDWVELSKIFECKEDYFLVAGGMISRPDQGVVVVITHPEGGKSFDYGDKWEGDELIYTGKGQTGDQRFAGENRLVAENAATIMVFEHHAPRQLKYLGIAVCRKWEWSIGLDKNNQSRKELKFRLKINP